MGVPSEDIGSANDAGGVNVLYGTASRLSVTGNRSGPRIARAFWIWPKIPSLEMLGDSFGMALAALN